MLSQLRNTFLMPLLPITAAGMLVQAIMGMYAPQSEIGTQYLLALNDLFEIEFIFMHSAIFFGMRKAIKPIFGQVMFVLVLFLVYGLFIWPFAAKNPWIGANYLMLTAARLLTNTNPIAHTEFYKALDEGAQKMVPGMIGLLKAGAVFLFIPLLTLILPIPSWNLTVEEVMKLFPDHRTPKDFIFLAKMFLVYFFIVTAFDIRKTIRKFTRPQIEEKVVAKSKKTKKAA